MTLCAIFTVFMLALLDHFFVASAQSSAGNLILEGRQIQWCMGSSGTDLVDNGEPHPAFYHKQLSEVLSCGDADECTTSQSLVKSFTIGFSSSISPTNWISGGFSVEQSIETGNDYECTVNRGESVCVWYKVAHTAYTVHNWQSDTCSNEKEYSDSYVMTSPNENNSGGGFYCVTGSACRSQSEGYWE